MLFMTIIACNKENSNPENGNNLKIEIVHGNLQTGIYNSPLQDSLVVMVSDSKGNPVSKAPISFDFKVGSGSISSDWVFTDTLGLAYFYWTIDCHSDNNQLAVYLNDSVSNRIDSVTFNATASFPNGWGKSCGIDRDLYRPFFRENNGTIYFSDFSMIYRSNDGGISWQEYENMPPISNYIFDIQFNSQGWMYVITEGDGIFYTEDEITWHQINKGMNNLYYPASFLVEDTCLFVAYDNSGCVYRSTDNGESWQKLIVSNYYEEYEFISRHPNGDLYLFDKSENFWHSTDNGDHWDAIDLDYNYTKYFVEDFIIDKDGSLYIGTDNSVISNLSSDTYVGESHSYKKKNTSAVISDFKIVNDIVYYTVIDYFESGIYSSRDWSKLDLGFEKGIRTYFLTEDGTFLIASSDGVYYYIGE